MVKPLKTLSNVIEEVASGDTDIAVDYKGYNELEQIAASYNHMLEKLSITEEARQEFVSNVSHELKTPLTSMKVLAESLIAQEDVPAELYREFMEDINNEIERANNIIVDLLTIVKTEKIEKEERKK